MKKNARDRTAVSTSEPTQTQERFAAIVEALADKQGVTIGSSLGVVKTPPLNPATTVVMVRSLIKVCMPRGGRPLVIANAIPASPNLATACRVFLVSVLSCVTSVPSTSARTSLIGPSFLYGFTIIELLPSPGVPSPPPPRGPARNRTSSEAL